MEILYILLSSREIKTMNSLLVGDHWVIRMLEEWRSSFNPIKGTKFQTLRERGILRNCWKWILKFLKIKAAQLRAYSAITQMRILSY